MDAGERGGMTLGKDFAYAGAGRQEDIQDIEQICCAWPPLVGVVLLPPADDSPELLNVFDGNDWRGWRPAERILFPSQPRRLDRLNGGTGP